LKNVSDSDPQERGHAEEFMKYQNKRGGKVNPKILKFWNPSRA
jgi:hypothetical protein